MGRGGKAVLILYYYYYYLEQRPSWEANRSSASQEISPVLWNPEVHHRIHNSPPPVPVLRQIDPGHVLHPTSRRSIFNIIPHLCLGLSSGLFPSGMPIKTKYTPVLVPMCATSPPHLSLLELSSWMTSDDRWLPVTTAWRGWRTADNGWSSSLDWARCWQTTPRRKNIVMLRNSNKSHSSLTLAPNAAAWSATRRGRLDHAERAFGSHWIRSRLRFRAGLDVLECPHSCVKGMPFGACVSLSSLVRQ
jgi:hypothetical protein